MGKLSLKKYFLTLFFINIISMHAFAAQVANVQYIHDYITQKHGINVPIKATNTLQIANVKYLLTAVDCSNEILNGMATSYGTGTYATMAAVDTAAVIDAVNRLIVKTCLAVKDVATTADNVGRCAYYSGGTVQLSIGSNVIQPFSFFPGYIVMGTCSTATKPSGCYTDTVNTWTNNCISSISYSASGTYCWCRLKRLSDGVISARHVHMDNRGSASYCAQVCPNVCAGYLHSQYNGGDVKGLGATLLAAF